MNSTEAARTLCRSTLRALLKSAGDSPRHGYLVHEKLGCFNALSGAARFARMIDETEAGDLLDRIADAMLDNGAMGTPETARPHLERLLEEVGE